MARHLMHKGIIAIALVYSPFAYSFDCKSVKSITEAFLERHYEHKKFDDAMSQRSLDNYIKIWDPSKVYFLQADIDRFQKQYGKTLDDQIPKGKCTAIDDIFATYSKRFKERQPGIMKAVEAKHDFSVDEYLELDPKKVSWAKNNEELDERWRKRVKFQFLQKKDAVDMAKAKELIRKRFITAEKRHKELKYDKVLSYYLNAFSSSLDPHSDYYDPEQLENFRINTRLSLEGIGAVLRGEDGFTVIQSLVPGGAAAKTGKIKVDDKIVAVAQGKSAPVDVIDMDLNEVVKLIRGSLGTLVKLTILREEKGKSERLVVDVTREKIQLNDRAAKSEVFKVKANDVDDAPKGDKSKVYNIGVISLPSFYMDFQGRQNNQANYRSSTRDVLNELKKLKEKKVDAVVIDLRVNGGGSLDESVDLTGLFIKEGPVVQRQELNSKPFVHVDTDPNIYYDGPLVVMISHQSASASEIFAGAIKDYERGLIIGDKQTFGKGTVQNLSDMTEELGSIKVTTSKFYRPSGASTQIKGVESDVVLPSLFDEYEIGEKYYDYALPWDSIKPNKYVNFGKVKPFASQLAAESKKRVAVDPKYVELMAEIKEYRDKEKERTRMSLKEEKDPKKKDEKDKKEEEMMSEDKDLSLKDDIHLQETVRITADYVRLINGKKIGHKLELPELIATVTKGQSTAVIKGKEKAPAAKN